MVKPSIYFIRAETGQIKIGFTRGTATRLAALQCGSPVILKILGAFEAESESIERRLHRHFRHLHLHGEWFRGEHDLLAAIEMMLKDSSRRAKFLKSIRLKSEGPKPPPRERRVAVLGYSPRGRISPDEYLAMSEKVIG